MTRALLNSFSTAALIWIVVGGTTLLAVLAALFVRRRYPNLAESDFENLTGVLRGDVFALLYTIVLALVIADQSGSMANAQSVVSAESSALAELTAAQQAFPASDRVDLSNAVYEYVHAIVEDEFPAMREGRASPRAAAAIEALHAAYRGFEPQTEVQVSFYEQSVQEIGELIRERRGRLQQSQEGLSPLLRTLLVIGAVVFIILAYPASVRRLSVHLLIVAATAAFVSFAYLLTMVLDYPFAGNLTVDESPYKLGILAQYWAEEEEPRPLDSEMLGEVGPDDLVGKWNSDSAYGALLIRRSGDEIRGVYRLDRGTVVGRVDPDGVFRGWWCQEPDRLPPDNAGEVEWRLLNDPDTEAVRLDGRWRYGNSGPMHGGWDLTRIEGMEPSDLAAMFEDPALFCAPPG